MDTDALPIYGTAGVHFRTLSFTQIEVYIVYDHSLEGWNKYHTI